MDANIRQLIQLASNADAVEGEKLAIEAFNQIQQAFAKSKESSDVDLCGSDLYVLCAELCFKLGQYKISQDCLHMFFSATPLANQFLCRAYLCQAQLLAPKSAEEAVEFETAVVYLLKAISFAKTKPRYHFIVYNASVLYWQMARPFLRPRYRKLLHQSLQQVVKALEDIDDPDHEWRATLMVALVESLIDRGLTKEASQAAQAASQFTLAKSKATFKNVFQLQIKHKLVDLNKLAREIKNMPEYIAFFRLQKIKGMIGDKPASEVVKELNKLCSAMTAKTLPASKPSTSESRRKSQISDDSISVPSEESSRASSRKSQRLSASSTNLAEVVSIEEETKDELERLIRPYLLIEVARLCIEMDQVTGGKQCLQELKECQITDTSLFIEMEFLECELMVRELGNNQEKYTKKSVETRVAAVKRMEQALQNAVRSGKANLVQGACATQWNLCLPLLQRNLRKLVRRPLTAVAEALEDISSMQVTLRCQVHMELAKCEGAVEQVEAAVKHVNKALQLDDSGFYHERLHTMLHRLQLSTQLYRTPERAEDVAAIIIEQARKSSESGSVRMKRSLLVKAGLALAPDAFQYVLDSENEMKAAGGVKGLVSQVQILGARAIQWRKCVGKAPGHLKRLGDENDRERVGLWVDLVKTARQQQVWDVCRVATAFCLLYDDARWKADVRGGAESPDKRSSDPVGGAKPPGTSDSSSLEAKNPQPPDTGESPSGNPHDADLLRMLAEVYFIKGEAFIHLLKCEGVRLNESPVPPVDTRQRPKGHEVRRPEQEPEWLEYSDWIHNLNLQAINAFLRAVELGIELSETWLICSGAAYLWNYNQHLLVDHKYSQLVPTFERILFGMQETGHSSEATLLVRICDVIAKGLVSPWIPKKPPSGAPPAAQTAVTTATTAKDAQRKKTGAKSKDLPPGTANVLQVDPDATEDLKKALDVCEYGLSVTNGSTASDVIPTAIRHQLVTTWVGVKQLLQQQIAPGFGLENEKLSDQRDMTKALVMLEMLSLNRNDLMEFQVPEVAEVCDTVDECSWNDPAVALEVWTRLAQLARAQKNHPLVLRCTTKALALESTAVTKMTSSKTKQNEKHRQTVALEMLSYAACILGESLLDTCAANPPARRQAMRSFVNSARFAERSGNFSLVMSSCRRWWNAALPLIPSPLERELLRAPLEALLQCILSTAGSVVYQDEAEETPANKGIVKIIEAEGGEAPSSGSKQSVGVSLGDPSDDRTLRAAMYGVLFQTYADKGEWEEGLVVMDRALHHMPRTKHRLLLFKHRVIVKAKLGKDVQMDIAKFRDESEEYVSHMWHRVALCSRNTLEQLMAFQKSIEALHSEDTQWQKFEYLLELSTWMFSNEFKKDDTVNVVSWACDILMKMKFEEEETPEERREDKGKRKGTKGASKPASRAQATSKQANNKKEKSQPPTRQKQEEGKKDEVKKEEEQHVPVEREVIIGVSPPETPPKMEDFKSTRQLEGLIRGHVMMATISGAGTQGHLDACLLAYGFVIRLWKVALGSAGSVMHNLPKLDAVAEDGGRKTSGKKKTPAPPPKEKVKRKGAADALPCSTSEWSTYDPPDEIRQAFQHDPSERGINKRTITCAGMTVFHLLKLSDYLRSCAFNQLSLPVLSLAAVITQGVLQSKSWTQLINIKQVIVCYELHLVAAAEQWESTMDCYLTEEEQSASRQALELKKIHKELAKLEEANIRKARGDEQPHKLSSAKTTWTSDTKEHVGPVTLTGRKVGAVNMSEIWAEKAKLLIGLGHYQVSRALLKEALEVAEYNDDEALKADIFHNLAMLATYEGNNGQAIQHIKNAQLIGGDEQFWMENISLLVDALVENQDPSPDDVKEVAKIVKASLECINVLSDIRPTKGSTIGLMKATLNAQSILLRLKTQTRQVSGLLKKLEQTENLLQDLGFHRKLAKIHVQHADALVRLSKSSPYLEHTYLLRAINLLTSSLANLTTICSSTVPLERDSDVSVPVHREAMDLQLHLVEVVLEAFHVSSLEDRLDKAKEAKKDALQRFVEDYVGKDEADADNVEHDWEVAKPMFIHHAFAQLNVLHKSLPNNHPMRCRWLFLFGRALRLLGESSHPDSPQLQWMVGEMGLGEPPASPGPEDTEDVEPDEDDQSFTSKQQQKLIEEANKLVRKAEFANRSLAHSTEVLAQCIQVSLQLQCQKIVSQASLEMVECCAQCDPHTASSFLALHQSAEWSMSMTQLMTQSLSDPSSSQLAALLHQESRLRSNAVTSGLDASSLRRKILEDLERDFTSWRRMQLSPKHLDLMRDFPPMYNVVVLQHSPDRSKLYCAILEKPKQSATAGDAKGKGKDKQSQAAEDTRVSVARIEVDCARFDELIEKHSDYQQRLMSFHLQSEYQRSQLALRERMLQQLSKGQAELALSETALLEQAEEEMKLQEEFDEILSGMEDYLEGVSSMLTSKLIKPIEEQAEQQLQSGQPLSDLQPEVLVILAGYHLMQLPLEALECLQTPHIDALSRDFSLQLLHRRWFVDPEEQAAAAERKKNDKAPPKTPKGGKDAGKKTPGAKIVPLNRELPPGCAAVDTNSVHYIVDPHTDCSETEQHRPEQVFKQLMQVHGQSFTPRWEGVFGPTSLPSVGQWEEKLNKCSAFIFYGMERFIAQFPPSKLAALNLDDCQVALLLDKSQTNKSFRNQSKVDVDKTNTLLSIEKPLQTAMLLSLSGANCVCLNQWHTSSEANATKLQGLMSSILEEGLMLGQGMRKINNPSLKKPEPKVVEVPVTPMGKESKAKKGKESKEAPSRNQSVVMPTPAETPLPGDADYVAEDEPEDPIVKKLDASWCNFVLFGLPNLVVT